MDPKNDSRPKPKTKSNPEPDHRTPVVIEIQPSSPRYPITPTIPGGGPRGSFAGTRKIGIAVDLSDESAFAARWAVHNYIRPGDAVTILHVRPTSILYGADWGSTHFSLAHTAEDDEGVGGAGGLTSEESRKKLEADFDSFTAGKVVELAQPLVEARIPFRVHIVKDHDMKERLCLEIERLRLSAVIMGSRGFGASRRDVKGRLGSVSDYCVHHCVCPVVVVRYAEDNDVGVGGGDGYHEAAA